jgi:3-isopropylmalate/(R)-2-methylmalate dehydratase small subunit
MSELYYSGTVWLLGDNVPTDEIVPSHWLFEPMNVIVQHVLESLKPEFAAGVRPGDIIVAGHHFGQSSGRAVAPKALQAAGVSCIVADSFARTFLRNCYEVGLPILELPDAGHFAVDGDTVTADLISGEAHNVTQGTVANGKPIGDFLRGMLFAGGLIPLVKAEGASLGLAD